ncbi:aminotransferase class V-fold PLP-dependent enzyme [Nocardioides sp. ChNu-153]|uniref:aminotransferase class V-fold PLP-dependent enzyme n=1 Tax=Nocardioides sp. ChNu-153 TaxID=2779364 RepID=UPI003462D4B5
MENEVVGAACDLLDAPDPVVGTVTSGGTESVLLAVQTARDARPDLAAAGLRPRMVVPSTVHAAFHKAAHYFGVETVVVPVGPDFRADVAATRAAVAADADRTVLVAVSAPSYAHGVVDPVAEVAAIAARSTACAATSTRASAGGCCPTPRGWAGRCRRGPSRCRASRASRWTSTSTPTPRRAPRCCCTATPGCAGRSCSRRRTGRATRCSTPRCSRRSRADRWPGPGRCCAPSVTPATWS